MGEQVFDLQTDCDYLQAPEMEVLRKEDMNLPNFKGLKKIKTGEVDAEYEAIKKPKKYR